MSLGTLPQGTEKKGSESHQPWKMTGGLGLESKGNSVTDPVGSYIHFKNLVRSDTVTDPNS